MLVPAGVIFDFDGVVVDSLKVHLISWSQAYQHLYGEPMGESEGLPGRSTGAIADILSQRAGKPHTKDALAEEKRSRLKQARDLIEAMPGALESLAWLSANNIPYGIASNAPREFILNTLDRLEVTCDHVFGVDDVSRPKPAPDVFLKCAKACGIKFTEHARTIVFEDSIHGLKAAVTAGMYPIGVMTQHREDDLLKGGAKKVCRHIADATERGWFKDLSA